MSERAAGVCVTRKRDEEARQYEDHGDHLERCDAHQAVMYAVHVGKLPVCLCVCFVRTRFMRVF